MAKTSVDSEATKAPLKYNPRTESGTGFFPLLMRAWLHTIVVAYAVFRKWPITYEVAAAELSEALTHIRAIKSDYLAPLTAEAQQQVQSLINDIQTLSTEIDKEVAGLGKTEMDDKYSERLHEMTNKIFALAQQLDYEALGLPSDLSDAGKEL